MTILDLVAACTDEVAARAPETEMGRGVPDDLARRIGATGAFHLYVPSSLGGAEVDPLTANSVVERISYADGSTGWTSMILNTTFFTCWLDSEVAAPMLATDPELGMAGMFAPIGLAEPVDGSAVRLTGRYPFNSGSSNATWFCEGAFVTGPDGEASWRFLFLPREDVEILDTWRVAGLRGTASHDVAVDGAVVPLERTASPIFERARHDAPHFRFSFFALLGSLISGFPLGVARRALDEFNALASTKSRGGGSALATEQLVQVKVARCEGALKAARASVHDAVGVAWDTASRGDDISRDERIAIRLAAQHAMAVGLDVVDTVFGLSGGASIYDDSPIQRCWRDAHAGSNHIFFSNNHAAIAGRAVLGQPTEEFLI